MLSCCSLQSCDPAQAAKGIADTQPCRAQKSLRIGHTAPDTHLQPSRAALPVSKTHDWPLVTFKYSLKAIPLKTNKISLLKIELILKLI